MIVGRHECQDGCTDECINEKTYQSSVILNGVVMTRPARRELMLMSVMMRIIMA